MSDKKHQQLYYEAEYNHVDILNKYDKPYAKKIYKDSFNGLNPKDIPELQKLCNKLSLIMSKYKYQVLLDKVRFLDINPLDSKIFRKDRTLHIRSSPKII